MSLPVRLYKLIDERNAARAPLNTDGAHLDLHAVETRAALRHERFALLASASSDIHALLDALVDALLHSNSAGLDDRKMLLEKLLVAMSRLKDHTSQKIQEVVISLLYKDLPHPPNGFLSPLDISRITHSPETCNQTHPQMPKHVNYAYRAADGSNYNPLIPGLGKAGSPYARSVPSKQITPVTTLPEPGLLFDSLLKRDTFTPHPDGISSLFFSFANLVIHSIFRTNRDDWTINETSSYLDLSILYGNSSEELAKIRRMDGFGKLHDDTFADSRLLFMPPASCALLVLLNRNHNYIAQKLLEINEFGRFRLDISKLDEAQKQVQDDEIFHRTRLINCGYFMHIILGDYVGAILGLVRDGSDWRLDPLMHSREMDHDVTPRGEGNVVSIEFNLLYRWHSTLSENNEEWIEKVFKDMKAKMSDEKNEVKAFKEMAREKMDQKKDEDPRNFTFGGLSRVDGKFKDHELAKLIQDASCEIAGAFGARQIPECMRAVEIMTIRQARTWGTCSLNEFRKFIGLKPYSNFKEWNPDPSIHEKAAKLYGDINKLELHVGLQAEETKTPQPGAGLCPGYTISKAILADAVCLTRGDRFLTTDFTPFNLTAWGYQDCQYDKENGSYGGLLTKLLFRTLPDQFPAGSALAHFPFTVPKKAYNDLKARGDGSVRKYRWPIKTEFSNPRFSVPDRWEEDDLPRLSPPEEFNWKIVDDIESVNKVLKKAKSPSVERLETVVAPLTKKKWQPDAIRKMQADVTKNILQRDWTDYFKNKTEFLITQRSDDRDVATGTHYCNIVDNVINLLPIHWICDAVTGLPLKWEENRNGILYEDDLYNKWADIARYVYMNSDPVDDYKMRERAQVAAKDIIEKIKGSLDDANGYFANILSSLFNTKKSDSWKLLKGLTSEVAADTTPTKLAISIFNATIPTAAIFSKAITHIVDYFLLKENQKAREAIVEAFKAGLNKESSEKIMGYAREALLLNPVFTGILYRSTTFDDTLSGQMIRSCDPIVVDITTANAKVTSKGANYSRSAEEQGVVLPYQDGMLTPKFFDSVVPVVVGTILSTKGLQRAHGYSGTLTEFYETWHSKCTTRKQYRNTDGLVTPWPDAMLVDFEK